MQVSQRLLKPGADTSNIIQVYVCTIRALRHVDPSGVLLEAVSEPMRAYLKARSDTVRHSKYSHGKYSLGKYSRGK